MKKLNVGEFCWWLLLGTLILVLGKLLIFDELKFYLHPKMNKFVIAAEIILILLFVYQQSRIFGGTFKKMKVGYFVFLIPMFMLIMAGDAGAVIFENRGFQLNGISRTKSEADLPVENLSIEGAMNDAGDSVYDRLPADVIDNPDPNATDPTNPAEHIPLPQPQQMPEDPFLTTLFHLDEAGGQEIELTGFVYKNEHFTETEFHISRMQISCCAADSFLVGMLVKTPLAKELANNDWVRIKGTTKLQAFEGQDGEETLVLIVEATELEKVEPLETPYVYF